MKRVVSFGFLLLVLGACGGGSDSPPTTPPSGNNPFHITITTVGANPKEVVVPPGTRVLFTNNDTRRRNMTSDPHPEHDACPEINSVGFLNTGQSKETGNLNTVRTCGFHDHDDPDNNNVKGRIVIRP
jgi:plastocyanin